MIYVFYLVEECLAIHGSSVRYWKTYARNWKTEKDAKGFKLCRLETFEIPMNRNEGEESLKPVFH